MYDGVCCDLVNAFHRQPSYPHGRQGSPHRLQSWLHGWLLFPTNLRRWDSFLFPLHFRARQRRWYSDWRLHSRIGNLWVRKAVFIQSYQATNSTPFRMHYMGVRQHSLETSQSTNSEPCRTEASQTSPLTTPGHTSLVLPSLRLPQVLWHSGSSSILNRNGQTAGSREFPARLCCELP